MKTRKKARVAEAFRELTEAVLEAVNENAAGFWQTGEMPRDGKVLYLGAFNSHSQMPIVLCWNESTDDDEAFEGEFWCIGNGGDIWEQYSGPMPDKFAIINEGA